MTEADFDPFCALLAAAAEVCAGKPISEQGAALMFTALEAYPLDAVRKAVLACAMSSKFMPTLAEIREKLQGSAEDRARLAWQEVKSLMGAAGSWTSVLASLPATHYAIEAMGGWIQLCGELSGENLPFREKDFAKHFGDAERMRLSWGSPGVPDHLPGRTELENLAGGHPGWVVPPVSLADIRRHRAESVALAGMIRRELGSGTEEFPRALPEGEPDERVRTRNVERLRLMLAESMLDREEVTA